ncbi:glucose dehydrogenase [Terriglobus roseus DSM 18391]|uniref:Glucose dehydrogenase n=1 Tax=Terriglobus roseus (strain DSM 18391 / NRRL B-41598 / KBS 63) TaxID=926566 RepID=I3ZJR5_TERRK|nr:PQQ-binding-like beta-propeller repeat protein [Terriglobus roseus]AFL89483.1 glucose dehydrogenase [Terriglobus roseus DSM 18391]
MRSLVPAAVAIFSVPLIVSAQSVSPNDWPSFNRTLQGTRYAPQTQITPANASGLKEICRYDLHQITSFQTGPVVLDGVIYITTGHDTIALNSDTCAEKWRTHEDYAPAVPNDVNRGAAVMDGRVFRGTQDGRVLAYDSATGKKLWEATIADKAKKESIPTAVLAWKGLVFAGNAGTEAIPVKGRMYALDAATGKIVWEQYLVPRMENDALRGPAAPASAPVAPSEDEALFGGTSWTAYSLDPATGTLYIPGGDPARKPHADGSPQMSNLVALDARTGAVRKGFPLVAQDFHDWEVSAAAALYPGRNGRLRYAVATKDGRLYAGDAKDGSKPWVAPVTNVANAEAPLKDAPVHFCPGTQGGNEWNGAAYSPKTGMLYVGAVDWCTTLTRIPGKIDPKITMDPVESAKGRITAVNAETGRVMWQSATASPVIAAVTPTAGGVVLAGDVAGNFYVLDAKSGAVVWKTQIGAALGGGIVSYATKAGAQRVAIATGMKSAIWPMAKGGAQLVVYGVSK